MPFTAFHVVPVWPPYVRWPRSWDVLALSLGAMVPDLEIVTVGQLAGEPDWARGIMHSLLGVASVNLALSAVFARWLAPWVASRLDGRFPGKGWRRFAGRDFAADRKPWTITPLSAGVGGLSHLAVDVLHHTDTPLLWPWRETAIAAFPWSGDWTLTIAMNAFFGAAFFVMLVRWVGK